MDDVIEMATVNAWRGLKAEWVLNELDTKTVEAIEIKTPADAITLVKRGQITNVTQIPKEHRRLIETQFMLGKYKPETMEALSNIGMAV